MGDPIRLGLFQTIKAQCEGIEAIGLFQAHKPSSVDYLYQNLDPSETDPLVSDGFYFYKAVSTFTNDNPGFTGVSNTLFNVDYTYTVSGEDLNILYDKSMTAPKVTLTSGVYYFWNYYDLSFRGISLYKNSYSDFHEFSNTDYTNDLDDKAMTVKTHIYSDSGVLKVRILLLKVDQTLTTEKLYFSLYEVPFKPCVLNTDGDPSFNEDGMTTIYHDYAVTLDDTDIEAAKTATGLTCLARYLQLLSTSTPTVSSKVSLLFKMGYTVDDSFYGSTTFGGTQGIDTRYSLVFDLMASAAPASSPIDKETNMFFDDPFDTIGDPPSTGITVSHSMIEGVDIDSSGNVLYLDHDYEYEWFDPSGNREYLEIRQELNIGTDTLYATTDTYGLYGSSPIKNDYEIHVWRLTIINILTKRVIIEHDYLESFYDSTNYSQYGLNWYVDKKRYSVTGTSKTLFFHTTYGSLTAYKEDDGSSGNPGNAVNDSTIDASQREIGANGCCFIVTFDNHYSTDDSDNRWKYKTQMDLIVRGGVVLGGNININTVIPHSDLRINNNQTYIDMQSFDFRAILNQSRITISQFNTASITTPVEVVDLGYNISEVPLKQHPYVYSNYVLKDDTFMDITDIDDYGLWYTEYTAGPAFGGTKYFIMEEFTEYWPQI